MKRILLVIIAAISMINLQAQNSLVTTSKTGNPVGTGTIDDFEFAYKSSTGDLVLIVATPADSMLHFIDMNGLSSTGVTNLLTDTIPGVLTSIASQLGTTDSNVYVWNMENNEKTRSTFILASNGYSGTRVLFEAKSKTSVSAVNFSNVKYCSTKYSATKPINDIDWGNDTLYFTVGSFSLDGELAILTPPFTQNATPASRSTSMFKSNWGGGYFTAAPLERITYGTVNGKSMLMGVTTCAPGFSIPSGSAVGGGLLKVEEEFNVNYMFTKKVFAVSKGVHSFMFNYHTGFQTQRIGDRFIDGVTPASKNETNNAAVLLRDNMGNVAAGLQPYEFDIINRTDLMICKYNDDYFVRFTAGGTLKIKNINWAVVTGISSLKDDEAYKVVPNPVQDYIQLSEELASQNPTVEIRDMQGKVKLQKAMSQSRSLDVSRLAPGNYVISFRIGAEISTSQQFVKL